MHVQNWFSLYYHYKSTEQMSWPQMQVQINPNLVLHQLVAKEESVYLSRGLIYASLSTTKAPGVLAHLKMHRNTKSKYIYTSKGELCNTS